MSDVPKDTRQPVEASSPTPRAEPLGPTGRAAMQGVSEGTASAPPTDVPNQPVPPADVIESPKVEPRGFDASEAMANQDISDYLNENIPPEHLNNLESIEYVPEYVREPNGQVLLGKWNPTQPASIQVYQHEESIQDQTSEQLKETITHEIGHNTFYYYLTEEKRESWRMLSASNPAWDAGDYASTNADEDFAESYKWYVTNPAYLETRSMERYDFMHSLVFGRREYK